jgi:hypothetical protein
MIYRQEELEQSLLDYYETGGGKTYYVGFNAMSKHYNMKEGGVTDWTGNPGSGKSELLLECCNNVTKFFGKKHLIHMPDAGSPAEVVGKIMHKMSGKQFEEFYYDKAGNKVKIQNRLKQSEIFRYLPDVLKAFHIYKPAGGISSKTITPREYWDYAAAHKDELGIFSAVIDSWNYMKHDIGSQRQDQWLEAELSYRNELAEKSGLHFHTIIHPKSEKRDKNGKKIMPDMHSLKGGSEWANNAKTVIVTHREFESHVTDIKIDKAKPKVVGVQGICSLYFDVNLGGFYENINGERQYAHKDPIIVKKERKAAPVETSHPDERTGGKSEIDDLPF